MNSLKGILLLIRYKQFLESKFSDKYHNFWQNKIIRKFHGHTRTLLLQ